MTSSTKPEVHIAHCNDADRSGRDHAVTQTTFAGNLAKFGRVVLEIMVVDRQTDRHDDHNTSVHYQGCGNEGCGHLQVSNRLGMHVFRR